MNRDPSIFSNDKNLYIRRLLKIRRLGSCEKYSKKWIWYFVTKIVLTYYEKKMFKWSRKTFEIWGWRPRIFKIFEITRTIYSNSERSEQFLVTECFLTCSWSFSDQIQTGKSIGIQKVRKAFCYQKLFWPFTFSKFLRSLEQFIQTVKGQNNSW